MSISSEISRISGNVSDALTAISNKGVTVPSGSNSDDLADLIGQISGGGGTTWETVFHNNVSIQDWGDPKNYVLISNFISSYGDLIVGDTYRVTWNGVPYECDAFSGSIISSDVTPCIGDETLTDEPFAGQRNYSGDLLFVTNDSPGMFALKIEHKISGGGGGSTLVPKSITANGTYDPADDNADGYSEVTVALPSGTAGTPTATKGTVSNHSISVTPSVTNSAGVISGGTITGTAVTVTASELASGNKAIVANGTNIDVVGYSTVSVAVPSGGSSKETYSYSGLATRTANSYAATSAKVTVTKAGTYNISFVAIRGSSSGTMGTNLYIGNTGKGQNTTWNNGTYGQFVSYTNQQIAANTDVTIYATSGNNSRTIYVGQLIVQEV